MGINEMIFAGLDIETTGVDINKGHRLIQIGVAFEGGPKIAYDVRPTGDLTISAEALEVNNFTLKRIGEAEPTHIVDDRLSADLRKAGYKLGSITPVGWNVGGFDMCFVKKELPKSAEFFSYRTLDLTGIAMMYELRTGKGYRDLKDEFAAKTKAVLGRDERHDALYDAEAALVVMKLFKELKW